MRNHHYLYYTAAPLVAALLLLPACFASILPAEPDEVLLSAVGLRPVYVDAAGARAINFVDVRQSFGRVDSLGSLRIGIDTLSGINVVPVRDGRLDFRATRFFRVPGITFLAVIDSMTVRVSNFSDEVVLRFERIDSVTVVSRTPDRFAEPEIYPREAGPFECYDPGQGFFGGWVRDTLLAPKCLGRW